MWKFSKDTQQHKVLIVENVNGEVFIVENKNDEESEVEKILKTEKLKPRSRRKATIIFEPYESSPSPEL